MNRAAVDAERGFLDGFGQRGMRVAGASEILAAGSELDGCDGLGNQVAGSRAQDVDTEDPCSATPS